MSDGLHLVVPEFNFPPVFSIVVDNESGNKTYQGFAINILEWMSRRYNMTMDFVRLDPLLLATSGVIKTLQIELENKNVDIAPMLLIPTLERAQKMDFTIPISFGHYRLMVPYPKQQSNLATLIEPFDLSTWLTILMITVLFVGIVTLVRYFERKMENDNNPARRFALTNNIGLNTLFAIGIMTGHAGFFSVTPYTAKLALRSIATVWFLSAIVLTTAYTSSITAYFTTPRLMPIVNSFDELAASKQYKITLLANTALATWILNASAEPFKTLGDSLRRNPSFLLIDAAKSVDTVLKFNAAYTQAPAEIFVRIGNDMKANGGTCRLTASKSLGYYDSYSLALQKQSPIMGIFNAGLQTLFENGLLQRWLGNQVPNIDKCLVTKKNQLSLDNQDVSAPLKLVDLSSVFLLFGLGASASVLVFLCEVVYLTFTRKKTTQRR